MKFRLLLLMLLVLPFTVNAQECSALMRPVSLADRAVEATKIVEGTVLNSQGYWDSGRLNIYTVHTVKIFKSLGGSLETEIKVVTMGGHVDDQIQITSSEARMESGTTGMLFVKPFTGNLDVSGTLYELVGAAQGLIKYSKFTDQAAGVFETYNSVESLYDNVEGAARSVFVEMEARPSRPIVGSGTRATPVISSFSPSTVSAGTQTVLTINGSNFGATIGSVSFPDANSGGITTETALDSQIVSWSDTQIQIEVPYLAGTGAFTVTNATAESASSSSALTVTYNHINASDGTTDFPAVLQEDNGSGGFTFNYHIDFDSSAAQPFFEDALSLWSCESNINFIIGSTTTTDVAAADGINIVRFDNGAELPSGVLGRVTSRYLGVCPTTNRAIVEELDVVWNDDTNWYYGSGTPGTFQYDFKTVALHELGHTHQLGHVIDTDQVMHYALSNGVSNYELSATDIDGAVYTMGLFTETVGCGITPMEELLNCCDPITITTEPDNSSIELDTSTDFTVVASNFATIQWSVDTTGGGSFTDITDDSVYSGATTTTLSLQNVPISYDGYQYRATLENACGDTLNTATVTLSVNPVCTGLDVTTYTGAGWDNGTPDITKNAVIAADYDTGAIASIDACICTVNASTTLTVGANTYLSARGNINVNGTLVVENTGSVVQIAETAETVNNGTIQVVKVTPTLDVRDFSALSSPMSGESRTGVYSGAHRVLEIFPALFTPNTDPAITGLNFLDDDGDYLGPASALNVGQGYLVLPQPSTAAGAATYSHTYTQGTLNSGNITASVVYNGPATENNFNLMGNPYASAIDTEAFILANDAIDQVYFWEHLTAPDEANPGFNPSNYSMDDISIYNLTGGVAANNGGSAPTQYMASGQGFGILALQSEAGTDIQFTNDLRVTGNNTTLKSFSSENRIWLRMDSQTYSNSSMILVGFLNETTTGFDAGYDSQRVDASISLFSTLSDKSQLAIQARETFNTSMTVELGMESKIPSLETFTISIDRLEGVDIESVEVFLTDHLTNTVINLSKSIYSFQAGPGLDSSRFSLSFEQPVLNVQDQSLDNISMYPNPLSNGLLNITATDLSNQEVQLKVTNLVGQVLYDQNQQFIGNTLTTDALSQLSQGIYFVALKSNGRWVIRRIVKK
ncbi:T9SS type A sorting domain-containing protein [Gilvibacter sediminis]|uniref:T9SS type A sorting domain-containing protein n=1 Tax=Gilvibacter sediminis TaxID=379071 RepID=UPI00234FBAAB|nr:T9SS type A sorting domain-containing protein [Gilvibacter sediminis]MDC7999154.1 T9SS type A sorting domain-containing protein [Gilvibacter sediminis]